MAPQFSFETLRTMHQPSMTKDEFLALHVGFHHIKVGCYDCLYSI
jgi:hypothetical protein